MLHDHESARAPLLAARWSIVLSGVVVILTGLTSLTGWALRLPQLIQLRPGWGGMVLTTSICAVLSGAGLVASASEDRNAARAQTWSGAIVLLIASLTIAEVLTGRSLGIDSPALHAAMLPNYPAPGRMAPNTTLAFFLIGLAQMLWGHGRKQGAVRTLAAAIFLIGGLGFVGYCLGMKFLYGWYTSSGLTEMALPTALSVILLASGLWRTTRVGHNSQPGEEAEVRILQAILSDTMALVMVAAIAVAVTAVGVVQSAVFRYTAEHLSQLARDDQDMITLAIDHRSERAAIAGGGEWLAQLLRSWEFTSGHRTPNGSTRNSPEDTMRAFGETLLGQGFSGVVYRGLNGRTLKVGTIIDSPPIRVSIRQANGEELIWSNGFYLATAVPMRDQQGVAGEMLAQQPLPTLDRLQGYTNASSQTGALVLCGRASEFNILRCFPMRSERLPFTVDETALKSGNGARSYLSRSRAAEPLPMELALAGGTGTILTRDYRGHPITAAYSPLENGSLGLVLKIDTAETYAPIRRSVTIALPVGALIVLICLWLMQRRLTPLVDGLVSSREKIRQLALHDPLTGLPNRSLLDDRLRMALEGSRRNQHSVALAVVDLDDFKQVNDTLGHETGDLLLCAVARRLEKCVRASDTVARLGGDEFVLILGEIQSARAVNVMAQKILAAFSAPVDLSGEMRTIRLSMGFALSPPGGGDEGSLMRNADAAMYSAKRSGGSRVVIYEEPAAPQPVETGLAGSVVTLQPVIPT